MITLIDVDKYIKSNKLIGPVTSPQIFLGNSYSFHPNGLMSEDIFGLDGTNERNTSMSWINLNCSVITPVLFDFISKKIERRIPQIIKGNVTYNLNKEGDLEDVGENEVGILDGMSSIVKNINKINFRNPEGTRGKVISMMYDNIKNGNFFIDKLLVISPTYRDVSVMGEEDERKEIKVDDLTELYKRILELSIQLRSVSGTIFDILTSKMQDLVMELFEIIKNRVSKKFGLIRRQMLGKRADFSAQSVIVPNPTLIPATIGVPFRIICGIFDPYLLYGAVNSPYANSIPDEFHIEGKKYLGKESAFSDED